LPPASAVLQSVPVAAAVRVRVRRGAALQEREE